jgi:choloylglycine hydrolase
VVRSELAFAPRYNAQMHTSAVLLFSLLVAGASRTAGVPVARPCTGISLAATDGSQIVARTVEWALGDAQHDRLAVVPRGKRFQSLVPEGATGFAWTGQHGFATITAYGTDYGPDALNERGLYVGMYYFPGFADYAPWDPAQASRSCSVGDFQQWLLSSFSSVAQVREHLNDLRVVYVADERFGGAPLPFHWKIADSTGACIVVEIVEGGRVEVFDAFRGVITNSPGYDWHLTNLRNYLGLAPGSVEALRIDGREFAPLGGGVGLRGLPGDFTPPSRFVRAAVLSSCVRPLADGEDAVFEAFRLLDSFNIPVGATAPGAQLPRDIPSATQITVVCDLTRRALYFHTMHNRQVRKLDLAKIDFAKVPQQAIEDPLRRQAVVELEVRAR